MILERPWAYGHDAFRLHLLVLSAAAGAALLQTSGAIAVTCTNASARAHFGTYWARLPLVEARPSSVLVDGQFVKPPSHSDQRRLRHERQTWHAFGMNALR